MFLAGVSIKGKRRAYFDLMFMTGSHLIVGEKFNGPAIIEEEGSKFGGSQLMSDESYEKPAK